MVVLVFLCVQTYWFSLEMVVPKYFRSVLSNNRVGSAQALNSKSYNETEAGGVFGGT